MRRLVMPKSCPGMAGGDTAYITVQVGDAQVEMTLLYFPAVFFLACVPFTSAATEPEAAK